MPVEEGNVISSLIFPRESFNHIKRTRPHPRQVLRIYLFMVFLIAVWLPLMVIIMRRVEDGPYSIYLILFTLAAFGLPCLIPLGLRHRARHRTPRGDRPDTWRLSPDVPPANDRP
jgi:hypothetical protein